MHAAVATWGALEGYMHPPITHIDWFTHRTAAADLFTAITAGYFWYVCEMGWVGCIYLR